jgi:hypothetical protein
MSDNIGAPGGSITETGRHVAQTATDQAGQVSRTAADQASQVARTATDQAREVVSETARQARDLLGEASGQAREQASVQQRKAAHQLRAVAEELQEMAAKGGQSGVATEVAQQAAERIHRAASWLDQREPADLLHAVREFARRRPGVFLAGAAAAGMAAGRLTRSMTAAARSDGQSRPAGQPAAPAEPSAGTVPPPPDPAWTPMPVYPEVSSAPTGSAPYYPAGGVPGPGAAGPAGPEPYRTEPSEPEPYRPGQPS